MKDEYPLASLFKKKGGKKGRCVLKARKYPTAITLEEMNETIREHICPKVGFWAFDINYELVIDNMIERGHPCSIWKTKDEGMGQYRCSFDSAGARGWGSCGTTIGRAVCMNALHKVLGEDAPWELLPDDTITISVRRRLGVSR